MVWFALPAALRMPVRRIGALLLLASFLFLASCGRDPVILTGIVTDAYTGQPVPEAIVVIGETTLTTDSSGAFTTSDWKRTDTLAVSAPNYAMISLPLETHPAVVGNATLTITLSMPLRPNTLSGTITDLYTGAPVAGAQLTATADVSTTLTAVSGADGTYTLADVPEQFVLAVSAPGYAGVEATIERSISRDLVLRPNTLSGTIVDRYTNQGVAGAVVRVGAQEARTAADGSYTVSDVPEGVTAVEVSADGYAPLTQELGQTTTLDAVLRPDTLVGRLVDQASGEPIANATVIATTTFPGTDVAFTRIMGSEDGVFRLEGMPEQGFLQILAPGYTTQVIPIEPGNIPTEFALNRFTVRALYITAAVATIPSLVDKYVDLIDRTELNAIVIDLKSDLRDDLGLVYYDTQVPLARELGLSANYIDMAGLVQRLKDRGIYTIARIQLFSHDNALSDARPEWSIRIRETGEVYADYPGPGIRYAYLDPTNRNVWDYNIQLGVEAALMGFDEINYDYIRFPDYFGTRAEFSEKLLFSEPLDAVNNPDRMFEVITEFMDQAHRAVNGAGAKMSICVFGRVLIGPSLTIAQDIRRMGNHTDYIAPMPYPSLWWPGAFGISSPVEEPYAVIDAANAAGVEQIQGEYARLRPWLQDHTDPWAYKVVTYGPAELRAQIDATEKYPEVDGWMLYDSANAYRGAFNGGVKPAP
jgi:hypothetical protein